VCGLGENKMSGFTNRQSIGSSSKDGGCAGDCRKSSFVTTKVNIFEQITNFTVPDNRELVIKWEAVGKKIGGDGNGAIGDGCRFHGTHRVKKVAGILSSEKSENDFTSRDWNDTRVRPAIAPNGFDWILEARDKSGVTGNIIKWQIEYTVKVHDFS